MSGALDVADVTYRYPKADADSLVGVSASFPRGTFTVVMGETGAGKSTLLMTLNGVIPHLKEGDLSGTVTFDGSDLARYRVQTITEFVGLVLQDPESQILGRTVAEDVAFGPRNYLVPRDEIRRRIADALRRVQLEGFDDRLTAELSGGQKQRLAVAGVLALQPQVLCLDEPTSELDPAGRDQLYATIDELRATSDLTIVAVEHASQDVIGRADRLVVLREGRVVWAGEPEAFFRDLDAVEAALVKPLPVTLVGRPLVEAGLIDASELPLTVKEAEALVRRLGWGDPPGEPDLPVERSGEAAESKPLQPPVERSGEAAESKPAPPVERSEAESKPDASACGVSTPPFGLRSTDEELRSTSGSVVSTPPFGLRSTCEGLRSTDEELRSTGGAPAISISALTHTYPSGLQALRGVDLEIARGEYVAIVGQNGAGKTTLVKHLNRLLDATSGRVVVDGIDVSTREPHELASHVGYCFQNPDHQIFSKTVADEVRYGLKIAGLSDADASARIDEVLAFTGLTDVRDEHPFSLGKGERQRIAVASILALKPAILVVDEPTTGQDWAGVNAMMGLIDELNRQGTTIVMITHDIDVVARHARRVVVMRHGQIVADGPTTSVLAQTDVLHSAHVETTQPVALSQRLFGVGVPPILDADALGRAIVAHLQGEPWTH